MKISKLSPFVCVFAACVSFVSVEAQDNPAQAAARAALLKQMGELQAPATSPATPSTPSAPAAGATAAVAMPKTHAVPAAPATQPAVVTQPGPIPIVAPALPFSMTKEQRLQALLAKYKADQITPEQYHKIRAEILAEH